MSELIPEKRRDKNGRLVTRHVRPAATPDYSQAFPVPSVAPEAFRGLLQPPVKTQLREHFRFIPAPDRQAPYSDLAPMLGLNERLDSGGFHASDHEMYSVMSVTDRGTALALLEYGCRTVADVKRTLGTFKMEHLLEDNSEIATEAMVRRIFPEMYMRKGTPGAIESDHFLDYLEVMAIPSMRDNWSAHTAVLAGAMRLSDIRELGDKRMTLADNWEMVKKTLVDLASGAATYTADDAGRVIERYSNVTRQTTVQAMKLMERYGVEFALETGPSSSLINFSDYLFQQDTDVEKSRSLLRYYRQVEASLAQSFGTDRIKHGFDNIIRFHDAGANPDQVASGKITINQIEAINTHGIAPSISGGWL